MASSLRPSTLLVALALVLLLAQCALATARPHRSPRRAGPSDDGASDAAVAAAMASWRDSHYAEAQSRADLLDSGALDGPLKWSYGENNYTMQRPEGERTYFIYVPRSYQSSGARPVSLVFALHGLGDNAKHFSTRTNLVSFSEALGFILVYPQGSTSILGTSWNAGTCCADRNVDDIAFLSGVVGLAIQSFAIRNESIHTMGFSNGGFMSESLGCHLAEVFTSIASVSGNTVLLPGNAGGLAACDAVYKSPTSILHVHGNADLVVPWTGDALLGFPTVPDDMAAWVRRNGCRGAPVQTLNVSTFSNQVWSNCNNDATVSLNTTVELVLNQGGGHIFPMGDDWNVSDYILKFWNKVTPGGI